MKYQALLLVIILLFSVWVLQVSDAGQDALSERGPVLLGSAQDVVHTPETGAQTGTEKDVSSSLQQNEIPASVLAGSSQSVLSSSDAVAQSFIETRVPITQECVVADASIFLVKNLSTEEVIFERNSYNRWPIASVTKLMSALVVSERMNLADTLFVTQEARDAVGEYYSFEVGDQYSVQDLLRAMLVFSSNDAAYALADTLNREAFDDFMNAKAKEIGMSQTSFFEPSGLSYLNQSTASDVYLLLRYLSHIHPSLLDITRMQSVILTELESGKKKTFQNIDFFAGQKEFLGGKTGYIEESGGNLVTIFQKGDTMYFVAVLGSDDRFGDVENLYRCLGE